MGFFLGQAKPKASEKISKPLIKYGIPLSVMGLLLKAGINVDLIKTAFIAFFSISFLILAINKLTFLKRFLPDFCYQFGGLIGNTSFLGIPIAIAILPTQIINFTIGFDLGTTFFAWLFGPYLLQNKKVKFNLQNFNSLVISIFNSPASKGIIGALMAYILGLENIAGNVLWIPARIVIITAIIVVGTRLGIIINDKKEVFNLKDNVKYSIILKLLIFPSIIFLICKALGLGQIETLALVLQAGTPTAISTILMAEAYKKNQDIAARILFISTIISVLTIPLFVLLIN